MRKKTDGPQNSLGNPWKDGERWECGRCGKAGPDRDDRVLSLCLPRHGTHPSIAYHDFKFFPPEHAAAIEAKHEYAASLACPGTDGGETDHYDPAGYNGKDGVPVCAYCGEDKASHRELECLCYHTCMDDPATGCSLSGGFHVHADEPCPLHPDAPETT